MDLTGSTRATATAAVTVLLGGLALTLHGVWRDQATHSLAGVVLTMIALTVIILTVIHKWVTDTSTVRSILAATQREAQAQHHRYLAAQAGLENEQARLRRDLNAEKAALAKQVRNERAAIAAEFEERRAALIAETMEATVLMIRDGKFAPETKQGATLIRFPHQEPQPRHGRTRERGVVGP